ncbi:MAG: hypothetical protein Q4C09_04880 [Atopobiaceae bacterium]|nr:hypothetical protein [Atopobiaceae bacterium]
MAQILNELAVMNEVADILRGLSKGEQRRVVEWLSDYFDVYDDFSDEGVEMVTFVEADAADAVAIDFEDDIIEEPAAAEAPARNTFEGLYNEVAPKTAIQKIVTAAYWLETQDQKESWKSFDVNKLLKSVGVKISSVSGTLAIEGKKENPMVAVLDKSGDSMQARKTFRLSDAGFVFVEDRID